MIIFKGYTDNAQTLGNLTTFDLNDEYDTMLTTGRGVFILKTNGLNTTSDSVYSVYRTGSDTAVFSRAENVAYRGVELFTNAYIINNIFNPIFGEKTRGVVDAINAELNFRKYGVISVGVFGNNPDASPNTGVVELNGKYTATPCDEVIRNNYHMPQTNYNWDVFTRIGAYDFSSGQYNAFIIAGIHLMDDIKNGNISVPDDIKKALENSGLGAEITNESTKVIWTVNIDGTKNPKITITWDAPKALDIANASAQLRVSTDLSTWFSGDSIYLGRYDYNGQPQSFMWSDLVSQGSTTPDALTKISEFLANFTTNLNLNSIIFMQMSYIDSGAEVVSAGCYVAINQNAEAVGYGVIPGVESDGSSVVITRLDTDDVYDDFPDDIDGDIDTNNYGVSGLSIMTKSYKMGISRLKQLGNFLWNSDFFQNIQLLNNSPLQNIISCKVFPIDITQVGADTPIILGNVDTGVLGNPINENANFIIDVGNFTIPKKYNNFLDYKFTSIGIFLPMCGFYKLETDVVMDKTLNIKYYIDILTGVCKAVIFVNNIPTQEYGGQIGFDIPLSSQDRSQTELAQITGLNSAISSVSNGDLGNGLRSFADYIAPPDYFHSVGSLSPTVNMMTSHDVFIVIERPVVQYPSNYNHTHGKPCNLTLTLNNLKGFTVCENVDLSTITATEEEKNMIKSALESGIYL